jgi:hypothetical protein
MIVFVSYAICATPSHALSRGRMAVDPGSNSRGGEHYEKRDIFDLRGAIGPRQINPLKSNLIHV